MAAGVAVLVGAGYFISQAIGGDGGGADSPEAAVQALADSISKEDPAGAANAMAPDEARTLGDLIGTVEGRARKSGLADKSTTYSGLDVEVKDLDLKVKELSDNVARVEIQDGTATWKVNRKALSGQLQGVVEKNSSGKIERDDLVTRTYSSDDDREIEVEPFLITVKRDGGWYVSPTYTAAAWLAEANDLPSGDFDEEVPDKLGAADSPEKAVIGLADTIDKLDPETTLESLPSGEWSTLYVYRKAVKDLIADAKNDGGDFTFDLEDQDLKVSDLPGGYKKVAITSASGTASTTDGDGDTSEVEWELDGLCMKVKHDNGDRDRSCLDDTPAAKRRIRDIGIDEPFVVTVKDRGGWVVSPTATLLEYGKAILPKVSDALLYRAVDLQRLAPADAEVKLDETAKVTINDGDFANVDVTVPTDVRAIVTVLDSSGDGHGVDVYGPDGSYTSAFSSSSYGDNDVAEPGTYRLVVYGDKGDKASVRVATVKEETLGASLTANGELTDEAPAIDYTFEVPLDGSYDVGLDNDSYDTEVNVSQDDGSYVDCYDACELEAGITYRVRVLQYGSGNGATDFTLAVTISEDATIDGESSVDGDTYGGAATHRLSVPGDQYATIELEGNDSYGDLDMLICSDGGGCETSDSYGSSESITISGPFEGTIAVTDPGGYGDDYTLYVESD